MGFGEGGGERLLCGQIFILNIHLPNTLLRRFAAFSVTTAVNIVENIIFRVILTYIYLHL